MNIIFIGIVAIVIITMCAFALKNISNKIWVIALYILGLFALGIGFYLLPATAWKSISLGALIVGIVFEIVAVRITIRCKKSNNEM
ncbi:MAG: hypothetical protein E7264_11215 [Lachnospiraceae bacterium]|nr:hypothetical protein [Lachnospiraceae bacterium]